MQTYIAFVKSWFYIPSQKCKKAHYQTCIFQIGFLGPSQTFQIRINYINNNIFFCYIYKLIKIFRYIYIFIKFVTF